MTHEFRGNTRARTEERSPRRRRSAERTATGGGGRSVLQALAAVFGLVFLLVGIAGFIPGVTSDYDDLSLLGTDSHAELLGVFRVSILHNIVHLLFGVGLLAAARASWSQLYLIGSGIAYVGVAAYGFLIDRSSDANFLPVNHADNWLHVALAATLILAGLVGTAVDRRAGSTA